MANKGVVENSYTESLGELIKKSKNPLRTRMLEFVLYLMQEGKVKGMKSAAARVGYTEGWLRGFKIKNPGPAKIERFKKGFPELNIDWWLTGEGEMLNPVVEENEEPKVFNENEELIKMLKEQLSTQEQQIADLKEQIKGLTTLLAKQNGVFL